MTGGNKDFKALDVAAPHNGSLAEKNRGQGSRAYAAAFASRPSPLTRRRKSAFNFGRSRDR